MHVTNNVFDNIIAGQAEEDELQTEIMQEPSTVWFETKASSYIKIQWEALPTLS
jgi:hypothetical protein